MRQGPFCHSILEFNDQLSQIPDSLSGECEIFVVQVLVMNENSSVPSKRLCKDGCSISIVLFRPCLHESYL